MNDDQWRRKYARQPWQVWVLLALMFICANQIFFGPKGSPVVVAMVPWSAKTFAVILCSASMGAFVSTWVHGRIGAWMEALSMFGVGVASLIYASSVPDAIASWNTSIGLVLGGIAVASTIRACQVGLQLRQWEP